MSKPYTDTVKGRFKTRVFESNTDSHELVWHRDKADRIVTVLEGNGWFFQMDNNIPIELEEGDAVLYTGCDQKHWRPGIYEGEGMAQVFLHYVNQKWRKH